MELTIVFMRLLSFLLAVVLVQSQAFALSGGPVYPGNTNESIIGSYSGVLIPTTSAPAFAPGAASAIGLYSLTIPQTALATGTAAIFLNGRVFNGTISGFADPQSLSFRGLLDASVNFTISTLVPAIPAVPPAAAVAAQVLTQSVTASARGNLNATIVPGRAGSAGTATATRLTGTSVLNISDGSVTAAGAIIVVQTVTFNVIGAQQAVTTTTAAAAG